MTKNKSVTDLVSELQAENDSLKFLKKLIEKYIQNEFNMNSSTIKKMILNQETFNSSFESDIATFFDLKTPDEKAQFLRVFLTDSSRDFYYRHKDNVAPYEQG